MDELLRVLEHGWLQLLRLRGDRCRHADVPGLRLQGLIRQNHLVGPADDRNFLHPVLRAGLLCDGQFHHARLHHRGA